ncbi:MAG: hypothetical protein ACEPOW_03245 [Bacteroidales bacterium]
MKKVYYYTINLLLFIFLLTDFAFPQHILRKEIPAPQNVDLFRLQNCNNHGFLLIFPTPNFINENYQVWKFYQIDTAFNERVNKKVHIPAGLDLQVTNQNRNQTTLVFKQKKQSSHNFIIVKWDNLNGSYDTLSFTGPKKSKPYKLISNEDTGIILTENSNHYNHILYYDFKNREIKKYNISIRDINLCVPDIILNPEDNTYTAIVQEFNGKRWYSNHLIEFNPTSDFKEVQFISEPLNRLNFPLNMKLHKLPNQTYCISGLYGDVRARHRTAKKIKSLKADGVYFFKINNEKQNSRFYSFKQRKSKKKNKHFKQKSINHILNHSYIKNNHLFLFTESYYPQYKTITRMDYDYFGRLQPRTENIFEGYRFIQGNKFTFDTNGQLEYVAKIDLYNILNQELYSHICHYESPEDETMAYMHESSIASCIYNKGEAIFPIAYDPLQTGNKGDIITNQEKLKIENWYENNFLVYGYQNIQNETNSASRLVFFVSKVELK